MKPEGTEPQAKQIRLQTKLINCFTKDRGVETHWKKRSFWSRRGQGVRKQLLPAAGRAWGDTKAITCLEEKLCARLFPDLLHEQVQRCRFAHSQQQLPNSRDRQRLLLQGRRHERGKTAGLTPHSLLHCLGKTHSEALTRVPVHLHHA